MHFHLCVCPNLDQSVFPCTSAKNQCAVSVPEEIYFKYI